jgi:GntR family transcriptional regulator
LEFSMLRFHLSAHSNVPAYVQVVQQVRQALLSGALRPGEQLPTVKEVVTELAINPNTVLKAYRELEREGLVEGRQGVGTFALRRPDGPPPRVQAALGRSLARWVAKAQEAGLDETDMESLLHATVRASVEARTA